MKGIKLHLGSDVMKSQIGLNIELINVITLFHRSTQSSIIDSKRNILGSILIIFRGTEQRVILFLKLVIRSTTSCAYQCNSCIESLSKSGIHKGNFRELTL